MDETPQASVDKDTVFRTEKGLETYSYSFYNMLPSVSDGFRQDAMCDYGAVTSFDNFIREGAYSAELSSGWSWSDLRNINYFIENCTNEAVDESVRNNYIGLARFFRAYFYYEMVVRFGDVPWIDRTLGVDDELLYAPRDSRTIVMDHVLEDLDFACENISRTKDETGSLEMGGLCVEIPYLPLRSFFSQVSYGVGIDRLGRRMVSGGCPCCRNGYEGKRPFYLYG